MKVNVLAYSQKCESWWFWNEGSVTSQKVSIPSEFAHLSFTLGYGVKKIILETTPVKLPRCSFLQDEIIKNHQVLAALLPEIICSIKFSGYLGSLKSLQILAYLIWVLVLYQIMNTWKSLLASAFIMKVSLLFIHGHLNQQCWIDALQ